MKASSLITVRPDGLCAIKVPTPLGKIAPELFERVNRAVQEYGVREIRATAASRLMLEGVPCENAQALLECLGLGSEIADPYVQLCPGKGVCKNGLQNTESLARRVVSLLSGDNVPFMMKVGVSGCPRSCSESWVRDLGFVGAKGGWTVVFGGNAGSRVRKGDEVAQNLSEDEAIEVARKLMEFQYKEGKPRERAARFVERVGLQAILAACDLVP